MLTCFSFIFFFLKIQFKNYPYLCEIDWNHGYILLINKQGGFFPTICFEGCKHHPPYCYIITIKYMCRNSVGFLNYMSRSNIFSFPLEYQQSTDTFYFFLLPFTNFAPKQFLFEEESQLNPKDLGDCEDSHRVLPSTLFSYQVFIIAIFQ